jgi:hypothetical protein
LSNPISVQVSVARNTSLTYPAITICNKVGQSALQNVGIWRRKRKFEYYLANEKISRDDQIFLYDLISSFLSVSLSRSRSLSWSRSQFQIEKVDFEGILPSACHAATLTPKNLELVLLH